MPEHDQRYSNEARRRAYRERWRDQADGSYDRLTTRPSSRGSSEDVSRWLGEGGADAPLPRRREEPNRWYGQTPVNESYAGRGPRDYQRSDERIREDVSDRLTDKERVDASDITVEVRQRQVTLSGTVRTRDQKRAAEDIAESVSGVVDVSNQLRVGRANGAEADVRHEAGASTASSPGKPGFRSHQ
jgi:hypothetical protein